MQRVNERDGEFRGGDWGVKYFMRGPKIDWGLILLKPGQVMGEHGHREVEETFYCLEGAPTMIVDGKDVQENPAKGKCLPCEDLAIKGMASGFAKKDCMCGCRIYFYRGKQYPYPPKGMIKGAVKSIEKPKA